jgi:hypothetical protein
MKTTLSIPVDSKKEDLGVSDLIETHRELFEMTGGREQIAVLMTELLGSSERRVTRQMIEKWFNPKNRTIPSGVLLVTLLTACKLIEDHLNEIKKTKKVA